MIIKVGVPTMTYADLIQVLHELLDEFGDAHELDNVPVRIQAPEHGLLYLRTIEVAKDHSDFTDGRDPHRIIVLSTEFYQ